MDNKLHAKSDDCSSSTHSTCFSKYTSSLNESEPTIGGYINTSDGRLCWIAIGSSLSIIYHGTKKLLSYKKFDTHYTEATLKIIACKGYADLLLVGFECSNGKGLLCLYNHHTSKVLKSVEIPQSVTCIEVILCEGGATVASKHFSQNLRWLFGVVAVGTEKGHLYLIDLKLDENVTQQNDSKRAAVIEIVPTVIRDLPSVRDSIHQQGLHLAFDLFEQCHENANFHYVTPDDQIIETFQAADVNVTSLHFEPRCKSLFVGFSFGQFQIFDLGDLTWSFSSELQDEDGEVAGFVFQEPENDPKNFCYLWVVHSMYDIDKRNTSLNGTMFQTVFRKREYVQSHNRLSSLYSQLGYCGPHFKLDLDATLGLAPAEGSSRILLCSSIEHYSPGRISTDDDFSCTPSTSLFVVGWNTTVNNRNNVHLVMFDINSWYVAHMPSCYRGYAEDETYLTMWNLDAVLDDTSEPLLALFTLPSSLRHFRSKTSPVPHQFTQPSAYSLISHCLTTSSTVTCKMPSVQRQAIQYLLEQKCGCLVEPGYIFDRMVAVGLIEQVANSCMTLDRKRECILSSALDHGIFSFLSGVITDLASGEYAASGCTLRFMMDWAWKTTAIIKDSIDTLCVPIFDCSVVTVDSIALSLLSFHSAQLSDLGHVFQALLRKAEQSSEQSKFELEVKVNVVTLIHSYLKILRWFIGAKLLPEQLEGHISPELDDHEEFHFIYKQSILRKIFEVRRNEMKKLQGSTDKSLLMIDGLVSYAGESLSKQWRAMSDDDTADYPPPSLMALLEMYYIENLDEMSKHSILVYFLLDILALAEASEDEADRGEVYEDSFNEHRHIVGAFPQTFQIPLSTTKLIRAFWLLDHKEFKDSLYAFCEAGAERISLPWQHRRIMEAYMLQDHNNLALQYLMTQQPASTSIEDVKLHIDVYIKNGLPHHAMEAARTRADVRNKDAIFSHLLSCCYQHDMLHALLKISISKDEDSLVTSYLRSSGIPHAHDLLVLDHLRKSRYVKAITSYRENKHSNIMVEHDGLEQRRHAILGHIVQGYMNILPDAQREVAVSNKQAFERNVVVQTESFKPQPLSKTLNAFKKSAPLSHSALLSVLFNKKKETKLQEPVTPFRQKRPEQVSTTPEPANLNDTKILFANDLTSSYVEPIRRMSTGRPSLGGAFTTPQRGDSSRMSNLQESFKVSESFQLKRNNSALMQTASLLLQTPPIHRKTFTPKSSLSNLDMMTPQSILKVKLLREKSPSLPCLSQQSSSNNIPSESAESVEEEKGLFTNPLFPIKTPPVKKLIKDFKLARSQLTDSRPTDQLCTPKRIRFFGLNTSGNSDHNQTKSPLQTEKVSPDHNSSEAGSSGSDVSFKPNEEEKQDFFHDGLDSTDSGSDASPATRVEKAQTPSGDLKLNPLFTIQTPPVSKLLHDFKGANSHDLDERPEDWLGPSSSPLLSNVIVGKRTSEDADVDITGDAEKSIFDQTTSEREDKQGDTNNDRVGDFALSSVVSLSCGYEAPLTAGDGISGVTLQDDGALDESIRSFHSALDVDVAATDDAQISSPIVSGQLVLRLSEGSDEFTDAESDVQKIPANKDALEISSDEEPKAVADKNGKDFIGLSKRKEHESVSFFSSKDAKPETSLYPKITSEEIHLGEIPDKMNSSASEEKQAPPIRETNSNDTDLPSYSTQIPGPTASLTVESSSLASLASTEIKPPTCFDEKGVLVENNVASTLTITVEEEVISASAQEEEVKSAISVEEEAKGNRDEAETKNEEISSSDRANESIGSVDGIKADVQAADSSVGRIQVTHKIESAGAESSIIAEVSVVGSDQCALDANDRTLNEQASSLLQDTNVIKSTIIANHTLESITEETRLREVAESHTSGNINSFSTPETKKIKKEPIFLLSPPTTRSRRKRQTSKVGDVTPSRTVAKTSPSALKSSPQFAFSPPTSLRTRSQRKRKISRETETLERKSAKFETPKNVTGKPPLPMSTRKSQRSATRKPHATPPRSSRKTKATQKEGTTSTVAQASEREVPQPETTSSLTVPTSPQAPRTSSSIRKSPSVKTPTRRSTRERKTSWKLSDETSKDSPTTSSPGVMKETFLTESYGASSTMTKTHPHPDPESKKVEEEETQPVTTRRSSRTKHSVSNRKDDENDLPVVTRSSSKNKNQRRPETASSSRQPNSKQHLAPDSPPTVKRTSSRTRSRNISTSNDEAVEAETSHVPVVTRSSSKSKRNVPSNHEKSSAGDQAEVMSMSTRRRTRANESHPEERPVVTRTSSRTRRRVQNGEVPLSDAENQPTVTRSAVKRRAQSSQTKETEVHTITTRSSTRNQSRVGQNNDITHQEVAGSSELTSLNITNIETESTEPCNSNDKTVNSHRKVWTPSHEKIHLPQFNLNANVDEPTIKKRKLTIVKEVEDGSSTKKYCPITKRRRAKIFRWDKKKKTFHDL